MDRIKKNGPGMLTCFVIAVFVLAFGKAVSRRGRRSLCYFTGMLLALVWNDKGKAEAGIRFTSKFVLQAAVVLLGFGMNLGVVLETGKQSLPIIICTISTSLFLAWILHKTLRIPGNISTLIGVGSSICGGSAIAATAPVIGAEDDEVAQAISVIFFFNVLAAVFFSDAGSGSGI
ncbi:YeiH family protein [Suipraeoptans intestinalis]|uniref:YeiH family protein n=1 Tax=Suipraeoptans intestinalis TaxID=2606628 RepID=UPI0022A65CAD|nr:putative sulfate exporter family transporter [Suipraeoptans intestinalis]